MSRKVPRSRRQGGHPRGSRPQGRRGGPDQRRGGPPKGRRYGRRPSYKGSKETRRVEMAVRGKAGELGLDGKLRVELEAIDLATADRLTGRRGAAVMTPRGDEVGHVETIVGTLQRPTAIVRVQPDARLIASELGGREVFLG